MAIRSILYFAITLLFIFLLGVGYELDTLCWDPVYMNHMFNAVNHILNDSPLGAYFFTNWSPLVADIFANHSVINPGLDYGIYPVDSFIYFPLALVTYFFDWEFASFLFFRINFCLIVLSCVLFSEISLKICDQKSVIITNFLALLIFTFTLFSPWVQYMFYSTWHEVYFMLFMLLSTSFLTVRRIRWFSLILYIIALFIHYQFAFFFGLFCFIRALSSSRFFKSDPFVSLFSSAKSSYCCRFFCFGLAFAGLIPFLSLAIRKAILLADFPSLDLLSSSPLIRTGLFPSGNGGLVGSLMFLFGTPLSNLSDYCSFNPTTFPSSEILFCLYRSGLVMLSMFLLSMLSVLGLVIHFRDGRLFSDAAIEWLYAPLAFAFVCMLFTFQQSFSFHPFGYSYIWAFPFSLGLSLLLLNLFRCCKRFFWRILIVFSAFPIFLTLLTSSRIAMSAAVL